MIDKRDWDRIIGRDRLGQNDRETDRMIERQKREGITHKRP